MPAGRRRRVSQRVEVAPHLLFWRSRGLMNVWRMCATVAGISALAGCGSSAKSLYEKAPPAEAAAAAVKEFDSDGDGKISATELEAAPAISAGAERIDADRDGNLTQAELQKRFETLAAGSAAISLEVRVTAKGKPLGGATVTLKPAPFMGSGLQDFKGVSDDAGGVILEGVTDPLARLVTGYYEAHVAAAASGIDQVVGCEIADDASGSRLMIALQ